MKRPALSLVLAIGAVLILAVTASASSTYYEAISGTELPNATNTEGQFVGTATGSFSGGWYIDVKHQPLWYSPDYITGGSFQLSTVINGWARTIDLTRIMLLSPIFLALGSVATSQPRPDMFVYAFSVRGSSVVVNEGDLSGDLAELARIVLG